MKTQTDIRRKQTVKSIWKKKKEKKKKEKEKRKKEEEEKKKKTQRKTTKKRKTATQTQEIFRMHSVLLVGVCKRLHALLSVSPLTATGDSVLAVCM